MKHSRALHSSVLKHGRPSTEECSCVSKTQEICIFTLLLLQIKNMTYKQTLFSKA